MGDLQNLFNSSKNVICCVPSPGQRVIHRSTLHDAINEEEKQTKPRFLVEILTALEEAKGQPENEIDAIQQENKEADKAPRCSEENMDGQNNVEVPEVDSKGDESEEEESEREKDKINGIVRVLEKLERVHWQHRNVLVEMNKDLEDPGLKKVSKMEGKIQQVKESFGTREKKNLYILDQPNPEGKTALHVAATLDDDEATKLLLEAGANPNVVDSEGNSPLHIVCDQGDITTATCILKHEGRVLENKRGDTPSLSDLFLNKEEEEVKEMMEAIRSSSHRRGKD